MELYLVSVAPEAPDAPVDAPVDAPLDRTSLTAEEVSRLPGQLQTLHAHLIKAPKDMTAVTFSVPRYVSTRWQGGRAAFHRIQRLSTGRLVKR